MGSLRVATSVFVALTAIFVSLLAASAPDLPARLATHFDASGTPNAWMSSSGYLAFFGAFGLGIPVLIIALFYVTRWLPPALINIPRRNFWLAKERAWETHRYLLSRGLWLGCLMLLFMLAIHYAVIRANQLAPPQLAPKSALIPLGIFLIGLVVWIVHLILHFSRRHSTAGPPQAAT
jgi:uncharacterized membrane protein